MTSGVAYPRLLIADTSSKGLPSASLPLYYSSSPLKKRILQYCTVEIAELHNVDIQVNIRGM
jgi:hypothetical protein